MAKDPTAAHEIEDACAYDEARGVVAVIDGASRGFDPISWSRSLARAVLGGPDTEPVNLDAVIARARAEWDLQETPSLPLGVVPLTTGATVGIAQFKRRAGRVVVAAEFIGDIGMLICRGDTILLPDDLAAGDRYTSHPSTINAEPKPNVTVRRMDPQDLKRGDVVLLYSDGLGGWLVDRVVGSTVLDHLKSIDGPTFVKLVRTEQRAKRMVVDDVTMVRVEVL